MVLWMPRLKLRQSGIDVRSEAPQGRMQHGVIGTVSGVDTRKVAADSLESKDCHSKCGADDYRDGPISADIADTRSVDIVSSRSVDIADK
jgi:hypothetical protein